MYGTRHSDPRYQAGNQRLPNRNRYSYWPPQVHNEYHVNNDNTPGAPYVPRSGWPPQASRGNGLALPGFDPPPMPFVGSSTPQYQVPSFPPHISRSHNNSSTNLINPKRSTSQHPPLTRKGLPRRVTTLANTHPGRNYQGNEYSTAPSFPGNSGVYLAPPDAGPSPVTNRPNGLRRSRSESAPVRRATTPESSPRYSQTFFLRYSKLIYSAMDLPEIPYSFWES